MPVPFLAIEVVALIVDEVRLSSWFGSDRRKDGLSIALVCKEWQPLGEAMVWHRLELDSPETARLALERFKAAPHFCPYVRELALSDSDNSDAEEEAPFGKVGNPGAEKNVLALWSMCSLLRRFEVNRPSWLSAEPVFAAARKLAQLSSLTLLTCGDGEVKTATFLRFLLSSPHLQHLTFNLINAYGQISGTVPSLPFKLVSLSTEGRPLPSSLPFAQQPFLLNHLLLTSDSRRVRRLSVPVNPEDANALRCVFQFTAVEDFKLVLTNPPPATFFPDLWRFAAACTGDLCVSIRYGAMGDPLHPIETPSIPDLDAFLRSIPPSVTNLHIPDFYLPTSHLPPKYESGPEIREIPVHATISVAVEGDEDVRTLALMRKEGTSQWCLVVELNEFGEIVEPDSGGSSSGESEGSRRSEEEGAEDDDDKLQ